MRPRPSRSRPGCRHSRCSPAAAPARRPRAARSRSRCRPRPPGASLSGSSDPSPSRAVRDRRRRRLRARPARPPRRSHGSCASDLPELAVLNALDRNTLPGDTAFVVGAPEKSIGRLTYLNCRYGVAREGRGRDPGRRDQRQPLRHPRAGRRDGSPAPSRTTPPTAPPTPTSPSPAASTVTCSPAGRATTASRCSWRPPGSGRSRSRWTPTPCRRRRRSRRPRRWPTSPSGAPRRG